jgi:hypothetical protein
MKIVYQAEDGTVFDTETEAVEWEKQEQDTRALAVFLVDNVFSLHEDYCMDVARVLLTHYNVSKK